MVFQLYFQLQLMSSSGAGLPVDLKSQGNLIFFQGQGIVREF